MFITVYNGELRESPVALKASMQSCAACAVEASMGLVPLITDARTLME